MSARTIGVAWPIGGAPAFRAAEVAATPAHRRPGIRTGSRPAHVPTRKGVR